jgi:hypothetical protein
MRYPQGKKFAFTIIDDTDDATVRNVAPIYDLLHSLGILTTKTAWVYPPRGRFTGQSLLDAEYLEFIRRLVAQGFEVGMHNIGDGPFTREEIVKGIEIWRDLLGSYPRIQVNHSTNPDNIYWGRKRFTAPLCWIYQWVGGSSRSGGDEETSACFWGDVAKQHITYMRNFTFNGINTTRYDPLMPYFVKSKSKYSNLWFSSSDAESAERFVKLLSSRNLDRLEHEGGTCIVYTHFSAGFVDQTGIIPAVRSCLEDLASRPAWFAPAGELLDYLRAAHGGDVEADYWYCLRLDLLWTADRVFKWLANGCRRRTYNPAAGVFLRGNTQSEDVTLHSQGR